MIVDDRAKNSESVITEEGMYNGPAFESEIILSDFEHPKHLTVYDFGLADSDKGWHSPLFVLCTIRCIKNFRIRKQEAEHRRRGRLEARNRRFEEDERRSDARFVREQSDSVGPLPGEPAPETVYRYVSRERDDGLERGYSFSRTRGYSRERSSSREPAYSRRRQDRYDDDYEEYYDDRHHRQRPNVRYEHASPSRSSIATEGMTRVQKVIIVGAPGDQENHLIHQTEVWTYQTSDNGLHPDIEIQQPSTGAYWT